MRPKWLIPGLLIVLAAAAGFLLWASTPLGPAPEALEYMRSDSQVSVVAGHGMVVFRPADREVSTAFVFYPGGRVDYRSYAAPLHAIAAQGYLVVLLPVRLNLAIFDDRAADRALAAFPAIEHWVVGGHSLGGVAAALYAGREPQVDGLVLWAANPANDALKNTDLQVLSVYGTLDLSEPQAFTDSRASLPADAQFVVIEGGNHAQFGDYGLQPGDRQAMISRTAQQHQAVDATVNFLKGISR